MFTYLSLQSCISHFLKNNVGGPKKQTVRGFPKYGLCYWFHLTNLNLKLRKILE